MASGQALVCGNTAHLNGVSPPFSFSSLCFSYPHLQGGCQTETEAARELLIAAVADSREPLGLAKRPQSPVMQRGSQARRCTVSDR